MSARKSRTEASMRSQDLRARIRAFAPVPWPEPQSTGCGKTRAARSRCSCTRGGLAAPLAEPVSLEPARSHRRRRLQHPARDRRRFRTVLGAAGPDRGSPRRFRDDHGDPRSAPDDLAVSDRLLGSRPRDLRILWNCALVGTGSGSSAFFGRSTLDVARLALARVAADEHERRRADLEFRAVVELGAVHALVVHVGAVRGVQIHDEDVLFHHLDRRMLA